MTELKDAVAEKPKPARGKAKPAAAKAKQRQQFKLHGSILDVVLEQAKTLKGQLGKQDQHKYFSFNSICRGI